jgi:hypothetical protein
MLASAKRVDKQLLRFLHRLHIDGNGLPTLPDHRDINAVGLGQRKIRLNAKAVQHGEHVKLCREIQMTVPQHPRGTRRLCWGHERQRLPRRRIRRGWPGPRPRSRRRLTSSFVTSYRPSSNDTQLSIPEHHRHQFERSTDVRSSEETVPIGVMLVPQRTKAVPQFDRDYRGARVPELHCLRLNVLAMAGWRKYLIRSFPN